MHKDSIYIPQIVQDLRKHYAWTSILKTMAKATPLDFLDVLSHKLYQGLSGNNYDFLYQVINNYHPEHLDAQSLH